MNRLTGEITDIEVSGSLALVTTRITTDISLKAIVIEKPEEYSYLQQGNTIDLLFKETEVSIGIHKTHDISIQNRITGKITQIQQATLLSKVTMLSEAGYITAIVSSGAVTQLALKEGMKVVAMVKQNAIMLSE